MDAQQIHDLNLRVITVGGQEVDLPVALLGSIADLLQGLHGGRMCHAYLLSQIGHAVNTSKPNDIIDVDIVTNQALFVIVAVDDTHEAVSLLSEIIKKTTVLTEGVISVSWIVARRFIVSEEDNHSFFY